MSELDKNRKEYILTKKKDCQIIITCTEIEEIKLEENTKTYYIKATIKEN
jgi:recombinational DNA repair ATPase RecF